MKVLKDDVDPRRIDTAGLCNNVYFVERADGYTDLVQAGGMTEVFDEYYDRDIKLVSIKNAGGRLNPKFNQNRLG
jgi:hypothetical protein